jgi:hypothetical protein
LCPSSDKYTNTKVGDVEFPPLRPLDDFLLTQARYQIPPYNDLEKWNNRVCSNMLYYQTNYLLMMLVVFLLVGYVHFLLNEQIHFVRSFIHPQEVITGVLVIASVVGVVAYACSANPDALQFKREHPIVSVGAVAVVCYLLITAIASIVVFLYGLLLPILGKQSFMIDFAHARTCSYVYPQFTASSQCQQQIDKCGE